MAKEKKNNVVKFNPKKAVTVLERILLLNQLLPKEGSFENLKLLRVVRENLSFNEAENKGLQFRMVTDPERGQMTVWNSIKLKNKATGEIVVAPNDILVQMANKDPDVFEVSPACPEKEIFFGEIIEKLISKAIQTLDKAEKLTEDHFSLYEMFVKEPETKPGE